jgi:hypothetical protein
VKADLNANIASVEKKLDGLIASIAASSNLVKGAILAICGTLLALFIYDAVNKHFP